MKNELNGFKKEQNQRQVDMSLDNKTSETTSITANIKDNSGIVNQNISQNVTKIDDNSHKRLIIGLVAFFFVLISLAFITYFAMPFYKVSKNNFEIYSVIEETESISTIGEENIVGNKSLLDTNCHRYSVNNIKLNKTSFPFSHHKVKKVSYVVIGYIDSLRTEIATGFLDDNYRMTFTTDYYYHDFNNLDLEFTITYSNGSNNVIIFTKVDVDQDMV